MKVAGTPSPLRFACGPLALGKRESFFKNLKKENQKLLPLLGGGRAEGVVEESKLSSLPRGKVF